MAADGLPREMPAIVCDIDGVVYSGGELCGNSQHVLSEVFLRKFDDKQIPFVFLTNGGMQTEDDKVSSMNKKFKLA